MRSPRNRQGELSRTRASVLAQAFL